MSNQVDKGQYEHFMQKEIFEQPDAAASALTNVKSVADLNGNLFGANGSDILSKTKGVLILACGTSYHAGQLARYWLESIAKVPCVVEIANEYRFRHALLYPDYLVVAISQSGGTSDTVAAVEKAKNIGYRYLLSICNVEQSPLMEMADLQFPTRAGPEIGIASTKAFVAQLIGLYVLTLTFAKMNKTIDDATLAEALNKLLALPDAIAATLKTADTVKGWANTFKEKESALFIARGLDYPIALEGALKLKETSYIHSEAFPAGEFRHGPMALIDANMPTIAIAGRNALLASVKTIIQEIRDKDGPVFVVTDAGADFREDVNLHVVEVPQHCEMLAPVLHVVPLQLLAYYTTVAKGNNVDQPRNLVKEVKAE